MNGLTLANELPGPDHIGPPKLTVMQAAIVQGFPVEWEFQGRKTASYRQVGNAFPPPVAQAVGANIVKAWRKAARAATRRAASEAVTEKRPVLEAV